MTTTAPAPAGTRQDDSGTEHVDVLVVGAGVSGIGAAHTLRKRFPERSFAVLDAQETRGGTWWTHRYPGVPVGVLPHAARRVRGRYPMVTAARRREAGGAGRGPRSRPVRHPPPWPDGEAT